MIQVCQAKEDRNVTAPTWTEQSARVVSSPLLTFPLSLTSSSFASMHSSSPHPTLGIERGAKADDDIVDRARQAFRDVPPAKWIACVGGCVSTGRKQWHLSALRYGRPGGLPCFVSTSAPGGSHAATLSHETGAA